MTVIPSRHLILVALITAANSVLGQLPGEPSQASFNWPGASKVRCAYLNLGAPTSSLRDMSAVGMNAVMPKFTFIGSTIPTAIAKRLREWGEAGRTNSIKVIPVFNYRGSAEIPGSGRREVDHRGIRLENTPCPLDEAFWRTAVHERLVALSKASGELGLAGAGLDPEMYHADHTVFRDVCYCNECFAEFWGARRMSEPVPAPAARAGWLKTSGMRREFEEHFTGKLLRMSGETEVAVHQANPNFIIGLLDPGVLRTLFMQGIINGFVTAKRPLLLFSEETYDGFADFIPNQAEAFRTKGSRVTLIPGLNLLRIPAEHLAEQAFHCARSSGGYWIFTFESLVGDVSKLPNYRLPEPEERYWQGLQVANHEVEKLTALRGAHVSRLQLRKFQPPELPVVLGPVKTGGIRSISGVMPIPLGTESLPRTRGRKELYVWVENRSAIEINLTSVRLNARYSEGVKHAVFTPAGERVTEGRVPLSESRVWRWIPESNGIYVVVIDSGQNASQCQVLSSHACGFMAVDGDRLLVNGRLGRLFFHVPAGIPRFSVFAKAVGQGDGVQIKFGIYDSTGRLHANAAGDFASVTEVPVMVAPEQRGKVWSLAHEVTGNDLYVFLSSELSGFVSTAPQRVLVWEQGSRK